MSLRSLGGSGTLVLSDGGAIAALVNRPGSPKASLLARPVPGGDARAWLDEGEKQNGSW